MKWKRKNPVFNNYINIYDLIDLFKKGNKALNKLMNYFAFSQQKRVQSVYSSEEYFPTNWWDIPEVKSRWNQLMTGDPAQDYYDYVAKKYFQNKKDLKGLSLGCGTGYRELRWIQLLHFQTLDAIDLSEHSISFANKEAIKIGVDHIVKYRVEDINTIELPKNHFDVIFVEQSLHHFTPLKEIMEKINSALNDDGIFVVNEFVGPTRFQWTKKQIHVINTLLSLLPEQYKLRYDKKNSKSKIFTPSKLRMILSDPSESVESSNIVPYLHQIFNVIEFKEYGGTILQMLFAEIAQNFISDDPNAKRWINLFFEVEDLLLKEKEIQSDFIFAICKKR